MKTAARTSIPWIAGLAWIAMAATCAAQSSSTMRYQNSRPARYAMNPNASSRVSGRTSAQTADRAPEPDVTPPEPTAEPLAASDFLGPSGGLGAEMWDDMEGGGCDDGSCSTGACSMGGFRRGLWYGSVDYLLMRPRMSQAIAAERRTLTTTVTGGTAAPTQTTSTLTDESVQFPFKYSSSFRAALGYRLLDCGGDIQVAYWRLTGGAQVNEGPASVSDNRLIIVGQLECNPQDGQFLSASSGVTANILDVDFAKCLSLGGPQGPCDACFCPRWDLRWSAGARIADVSRFDNNVVSDANGNAVTFANINARFVGAGPRVGVQGRRFFGQCGQFAAFAKASQALLIGNYNMSRVKTTPGDAPVPNDVTIQNDHFARLIPVTDIEIGATWQVAPYAFITAGWFFQCWWDLGQAENITAGTSFGPLDSANILGFDGLFVRGELMF